VYNAYKWLHPAEEVLMRSEYILVIVIVAATLIISLIVKKATSSKQQWIPGMQCPKCIKQRKKSKVRWAGYSDRKICQRGHIFT
jgi:hypothetical protein